MQFSYVNPTMIHFGQGQIASIRRDIPKESQSVSAVWWWFH